MTIKPYSLLALLALGVSLPAAADMKKAPATKAPARKAAPRKTATAKPSRKA